MRIQRNRSNQSARRPTPDSSAGSAARKCRHDLHVQLTIWIHVPALLQIGSVAIKRLMVVADLPAGESALNFRDSVFQTVSSPEPDTILKLAERNPIVAAVGIFNVFHPRVWNLA